MTRDSPASASDRAFCASRAALVVSVTSRSSPRAASRRDQDLEIATQQRLSAGDPELLHAELHEHARDPLDLLEREELAARQEPVVVPEDLLRHAVDAAEVAAVRDGDPQVANRPAEGVEDGHADGA